MANISGKRIPQVIVGLTGFWLLVLGAFFWTGEYNFQFLLFWLLCIFAGAVVAQWSSREYTDKIFERLNYNKKLSLPVTDFKAFRSQERGVTCTLGHIPFSRDALPSIELDNAQILAMFAVHLPQELPRSFFFNQLEKFGIGIDPRFIEKYPGHSLLARRIIGTLLHPDSIKHPAGIDRHGGRSLLTHSLLVTGLLLHRVHSFKPTSKHYSLLDDSFKLDPVDPLLLIVGLSHDIGKLTKLYFSEKFKEWRLVRGHVSESVQILAAFDEYWHSSISPDERITLQNIIAYSDAFDSIPIQPSEDKRPKVLSDRMFHIFSLLGECDRLASSIEEGASYDFMKGVAALVESEDESEEVDRIDFFGEIVTFLSTKAVINSGPGTDSDALHYKGLIDEVEMDVLVVAERRFSDSFADFLKKPHLKDRDGKRGVITTAVLEALDENSVLVRNPKEVGHRKAEDCLYNMVFMSLDPSATEPAFTLSSAFVINISSVDKLQFVSRSANCKSIPSFNHSIFGNKGQTQPRRKSVLDSAIKEELTGKKAVIDANALTAVEKLANEAKNLPTQIAKKIKSEIKLSIKNRVISGIKDTNGNIHVVGHDDFFTATGIKLEPLPNGNDFLTSVGIIRIMPSKKDPSAFVVSLNEATYGMAFNAAAKNDSADISTKQIDLFPLVNNRSSKETQASVVAVDDLATVNDSPIKSSVITEPAALVATVVEPAAPVATVVEPVAPVATVVEPAAPVATVVEPAAPVATAVVVASDNVEPIITNDEIVTPLTNNHSPVKPARQGNTPSYIIEQIKLGFKNQAIKGLVDTEGNIHVVGSGAFFMRLGIKLKTTDGDNKFLESVGILRIKPSKKDPSAFVVTLGHSTYQDAM